MLADEKAVVLLDRAPEELERHDEQDDADAGACEHACRGDVPGGGDEAGVDCVPVPEHLGFGWLASVMDTVWGNLQRSCRRRVHRPYPCP